MKQGKRLAIWLVVTVGVAIVFGMFIWYQRDQIFYLQEEMGEADQELLEAQSLVEELTSALDLARSEIPEPEIYQVVEIPQAHVSFEIPSTWHQPTVRNIEHIKEATEQSSVELVMDHGLKERAMIWYKTDAFRPGRESRTSEVFGTEIIERGGLEEFCQAGALRGAPIIDCQVHDIDGQTFVSFITGDPYALGSDARIPVYTIIGTLPMEGQGEYDLLNLSFPLMEEPLAFIEFDQAITSIQARELDKFVTQTTLNIVQSAEHLLGTMKFLQE